MIVIREVIGANVPRLKFKETQQHFYSQDASMLVDGPTAATQLSSKQLGQPVPQAPVRTSRI